MLAALGKSRTSLRETAENSNFSHGILHCYFSDKVAFITRSVRRYKARCVTRYVCLIADATSKPELLHGLLEIFGETLRNEASLHRLWSNLRSQALYDAAFRRDVAAIEQILEDMMARDDPLRAAQ